MTHSLTDFFRERKERADAAVAGVNWERRRREWLDAVSGLYGKVEEFVGEAQAQGSVAVSRRPKQVSESHLGTYQVDELLLTVGDEQVVFSPKGRNVVGAMGRVDVRGEAGDAMLVLEPGPRWQVVTSRHPTLRLSGLTAETFADLLDGIMRH